MILKVPVIFWATVTRSQIKLRLKILYFLSSKPDCGEIIQPLSLFEIATGYGLLAAVACMITLFTASRDADGLCDRHGNTCLFLHPERTDENLD